VNLHFKTIGVVAKPSNAALLSLKKLITILLKHKLTVLCEKTTAQHLPQHNNLRLCDLPLLSKNCDLVIIIGGDGTFLKTARLLACDQVYLLGINQGALGFLADINPNQLENKINEILAGKYTKEARFLLGAYVKKENKLKEQFSALNEITIISDNPSHMLEFEIYIDDIFLCAQKSNGVIIATPTGSTAYALSGGGPILYPTLNAITIVPMFPHTLSLRPIVIGANSTVNIIVSKNCKYKAIAYGDSQNSMEINNSNQISIKKIKKTLHLIHPMDYDYFKTLRHKLGWGHNP